MPRRPQTMLEALAWAAQRARRAAEVPRWQVAARADLDDRTIARFEQLVTGTRYGWPVDPERLVNAYAACADLHPREIWQAAVNAWANDDG